MTVKSKRITSNIISIIFKIIIALIFILPLYWGLLISFTPSKDIVSEGMKLYPKSISFEHYKYVFQVGNLFDAVKNTLVMTLLGVGLNLVLCTIAAYAFARVNFKGKSLLFKFMMLGLMIPGIVTLVPSLLIVDKLGLYGTWMGVVLPGAAGIFNIFMLRQFFLTLPPELAESARIDGANEFQIFNRIYLPLIAPALATITIFTIQGNWNSFLWPYLILKSDQLVITTFIRNIEAQGNIGTSMAASMLATIPLIIVFLFFQKYFTEVSATAGIK